MKWLEKNNFGKHQLSILKDIFEEKKHSPHDLGYWIDYVFKFGTEHLNAHYTQEVPALARFDFDLYLFVFSVIALLLYIWIKVTLWLLRKCCCRSSNKSVSADKAKKD
jgi:hypothetical protein